MIKIIIYTENTNPQAEIQENKREFSILNEAVPKPTGFWNKLK
jgi:hypothetical protein